MVNNLSKHFFLEFVVGAISDVNFERDRKGFTYALKAMICSELACDVNGE